MDVGGYASGSVARCNTRRYHGLFVPGLEKKGRTVLLARLGEEVLVGGRAYRLDAEEHPDGTQVSDPATCCAPSTSTAWCPIGCTRWARRACSAS